MDSYLDERKPGVTGVSYRVQGSRRTDWGTREKTGVAPSTIQKKRLMVIQKQNEKETVGCLGRRVDHSCWEKELSSGYEWGEH